MVRMIGLGLGWNDLNPIKFSSPKICKGMVRIIGLGFWFMTHFIFIQQCIYTIYTCRKLHYEWKYQSFNSLWQCKHPDFITNSSNKQTLRCRVVSQTVRHQLKLLPPQHCPPPPRGEVQQLECIVACVCHQDLAFPHGWQAPWFTRRWKREGL